MPNKSSRKPNSSKISGKPVKSMHIALPTAPLVHDLISRKLRSYYDEVTREPVPDRFAALLQQLESKTSPKKSN